MSCRVFVRTIAGQLLTVNVETEDELMNMTVEKLLKRLLTEDKLSLVPLSRVSYNGKKLQFDHTLGSYGIKHEETVYWILPLYAGGPGLPPDEDKRVPRTQSMEKLALMQQTEPESNKSCRIL
ncbi:uncharacterized protein [Danio rerio]|uniref:Uncharacterized protein n=1 Tax=Danio rerio TaxID=7955 RepID=A0AC58IWF0_DANRE